MNRILTLLAFVTFSGGFFTRSADPIIPQIAAGLHVEPATAALLSTAFALPYAFVQPVLGMLSDVFNKARLMLVCVAVLALASVACALAPNFESLFVARIVAGAASGGTMPIALALIGDLVPVRERQVAIGRVIFASLFGSLFGAFGAGAIADLFDWRMVFFAMAGVGVLIFAISFPGLRRIGNPGKPFDLADIGRNYRAIFANPLTKICFVAVLLEGAFLVGLFPHVASLLRGTGETRASIAGLVLAGFGLGGILYTFTVRRLLSYLGETRMMYAGGITMGLGLFVVALQPIWPIAFANMVVLGVAFFMVHGVIQIYASELVPTARGSALSLHSSFFFAGQAIGPAVYGLAFALAGPAPMLSISAVVLAAVGVICGATLKRTPPPVKD